MKAAGTGAAIEGGGNVIEQGVGNVEVNLKEGTIRTEINPLELLIKSVGGAGSGAASHYFDPTANTQGLIQGDQTALLETVPRPFWAAPGTRDQAYLLGQGPSAPAGSQLVLDMGPPQAPALPASPRPAPVPKNQMSLFE
jgi:hypothetical protein